MYSTHTHHSPHTVGFLSKAFSFLQNNTGTVLVHFTWLKNNSDITVNSIIPLYNTSSIVGLYNVYIIVVCHIQQYASTLSSCTQTHLLHSRSVSGMYILKPHPKQNIHDNHMYIFVGNLSIYSSTGKGQGYTVHWTCTPLQLHIQAISPVKYNLCAIHDPG